MGNTIRTEMAERKRVSYPFTLQSAGNKKRKDSDEEGTDEDKIINENTINLNKMLLFKTGISSVLTLLFVVYMFVYYASWGLSGGEAAGRILVDAANRERQMEQLSATELPIQVEDQVSQMDHSLLICLVYGTISGP